MILYQEDRALGRQNLVLPIPARGRRLIGRGSDQKSQNAARPQIRVETNASNSQPNGRPQPRGRGSGRVSCGPGSSAGATGSGLYSGSALKTPRSEGGRPPNQATASEGQRNRPDNGAIELIWRGASTSLVKPCPAGCHSPKSGRDRAPSIRSAWDCLSGQHPVLPIIFPLDESSCRIGQAISQKGVGQFRTGCLSRDGRCAATAPPAAAPASRAGPAAPAASRGSRAPCRRRSRSCSRCRPRPSRLA